MRLTADLIKAAPTYLNPLGEREISFRGNKIPAIENLGVTEDQYQCMDFADNELLLLDNFPILNRLTTLLLSGNKVCRVTPGLEQYLPQLSTLILCNNKLANLKDLDPLWTLPRLERLALMGNAVCKQKNYRLYVIHKLPSVTLLDFRKVKPSERKEAEALFGPAVPPPKAGAKAKGGDVKQQAAAGAGGAAASKTFTPGQGVPTIGAGAGASSASSAPGGSAAPLTTAATLTGEQRAKILSKIQNATTLAEIAALEDMLKTGKLPAGF